MASARKKQKSDPIRDAAIEHFAARSHNAWRRRFHQTNPAEKAQPRMRLRAGAMVDVNQPWAKLHPKAKADNIRAARDAYEAVRRFPNDREAASAYVHECWMRRNKGDASQPKALFKPYDKLPELEKDKDRAHIDQMKRSIAAVKRAQRETPATAKAKTMTPAKAKAGALKLDARAARRLQAAAKDLSKALGREVPLELLLVAGVEAAAAIAKAIAAQARAKG